MERVYCSHFCYYVWLHEATGSEKGMGKFFSLDCQVLHEVAPPCHSTRAPDILKGLIIICCGQLSYAS